MLTVAALSNGKWFCHFGKRKGKREKNPVRWKVKRRKKLYFPIVWEVKREKINFYNFFWKWKDKIKLISLCSGSEKRNVFAIYRPFSSEKWKRGIKNVVNSLTCLQICWKIKNFSNFFLRLSFRENYVKFKFIYHKTRSTWVRLPSKPASEFSNGPNLCLVELWELVF